MPLRGLAVRHAHMEARMMALRGVAIPQICDRAPVDPRSKLLDSRSRQVGSRSQQVDPRSETLDPRSRQVDSRSQQADPRSETLDARSKQVNSRSQRLDSRSEHVDPEVE